MSVCVCMCVCVCVLCSVFFFLFRVTAMAVFGDSVKQNTYSGIALVHESGKIEIQYYTRDFTVPIPAEEEKLESMINEAL